MVFTGAACSWVRHVTVRVSVTVCGNGNGQHKARDHVRRQQAVNRGRRDQDVRISCRIGGAMPSRWGMYASV
jgi:hypothetical protein